MNGDRSAWRIALVAALAATALYGSSFPYFRQYDLRNPEWNVDARDYVRMSHGDFDVFPVRRYRPLVPALAAVVRVPLVPVVADPVLRDRLAFYVVNFAFALVAALALYAILRTLDFSWATSLIGMLLFVASRVTVTSVGSPIVDAPFLAAIAVVLLLTLRGKPLLLGAAMPFLALTKDAILPFLLLPLLDRRSRKWAVVAGIGAAFAVTLGTRWAIDHAFPLEKVASLGDVAAYLYRGNVLRSLQRLGTLAGVHDLLHGFGLLAPLALGAIAIGRVRRSRPLPPVLLATVPIAFAYALLSFNLGRMFFAAFVPVIAYSMVALEFVFARATEQQRAAQPGG